MRVLPLSLNTTTFSGKKQELKNSREENVVKTLRAAAISDLRAEVSDLTASIAQSKGERSKCVVPEWIPFSKAARIENKIRQEEQLRSGILSYLESEDSYQFSAAWARGETPD